MSEETSSLPQHAFHCNLPAHHLDDDGVPFVTTYAHQKARKLVETVMSIEIAESLFEKQDENPVQHEIMVGEEEDLDDEDDENPHDFLQADTLPAFIRKCARLQSQFTTVENLKYSGSLETVELCQMVLHLLRLLTCSISYNPVQLHFEDVGFIFRHSNPEDIKHFNAKLEDLAALQKDLQRPFALPSPARESLLAILINLMSNKAPLRVVSNSSIYTDDVKKEDRFLLILDWKVLLRMLLRTAPYLDEHCSAKLPVDSSSRQATVLKRTVQLIRSSRHYFDQGLLPGSEQDAAAKAIWGMVQTDALFHSHTHACYRASIILYLFHPSKCSAEYYDEVMPLWWECWTNIDRCPEFDFLWLANFCRARKYNDSYNWSRIRQRLLTNAQYWLQLPIGGTSLDKSFPRVANPRSRSCPPRLKVFVGASSSYEEGIDFVAKVAKLLVVGLGSGKECEDGGQKISEGTRDVLRFLNYVTPYFNPSNLGSWTFTLGAFLHYFCYEMCARVGASVGLESVAEQYLDVAQSYASTQPGVCKPIPPHETVQLLDALLPLCQQAMYSKNGHVGRAGEAAMLYLVQLDPKHATPAFVDFAMRALDVGAVNLSHQAPSALSALTRLVHPSLRSGSLLIRLPAILSLSLAGIDSNDQNKTLRTLILYRSITSWIPVGGQAHNWPTLNSDTEPTSIGTVRLGKNLYQKLAERQEASDYVSAIRKLDDDSLLKNGLETVSADLQEVIVTEAMSAISDWALEFLERIFDLLRASGEREKTSKTTSGVASRHSSADVHAARNFSRVLKETLMQVFAAMDDEVHIMAIRSVCKFIAEESHPSAGKDASLLCQAAAAARKLKSGKVSSPGLDSLIDVLTDELPRHSTKTLVYRLRCLAGAVRLAGPGLLEHRRAISAAIDFALASSDRHLYKTGCKLLRHTLSTLSESYPISSENCPRAFSVDNSVTPCLGRSAQLDGDPIVWHVPDEKCVQFAHELLTRHVESRLDDLCMESSEGSEEKSGRSKLLNSLDVNQLRRCLRVIRYSIRGGASYLLDKDQDGPRVEDMVPYEIACNRLLTKAPDSIRNTLIKMRVRLASFLVVLSAVVASDTLYPDALTDLPDSETYRKGLPLISADPKVCKETCLIALLLLTRRGASFRSQEARTIWKAQKQLATDYSLSAQVEQIGKALQFSALYCTRTNIFYKDGEDAGKCLPRRLLVGRVQLFHDSLQRNASFETPRRLRRLNRRESTPRTILFNAQDSLSSMLTYLERRLVDYDASSLDTYEGICDGLCALCCHSNTQVRASAIGVIDYAMTRFAWLVSSRVPRLLSAISLTDSKLNGKFGFPSCSSLVDKVNSQGKRKRLSEAIKGVCSILSLNRSVKQLLSSEPIRLQLAQTICGTDRLIFLLPAEEVHKIVHYLQIVFSPYRSKVYYLPRVSNADEDAYIKTLALANDILAEKKVDPSAGDNGSVAVHWRKLLLGCWFLLTLIDEEERSLAVENQLKRTWETCFRIIEVESGQPLQRVALGLLGRLLSSGGSNLDMQIVENKICDGSFTSVIGQALVFDHREDNGVGGGNDAQWSAGVEDIIRDASRNISLRTLFPFQRTSQSMGSFKSSHCQLIENILKVMQSHNAKQACLSFLKDAKDMAAAPPNEDQRNQQITSAEIYAGVCCYMIQNTTDDTEMMSSWRESLLPFLEDVMLKLPFALAAAYFDALRYALQFAAPRKFLILTEWLVDKVISTLWNPTEPEKVSVTSSNGSGSDGFTTQSKWLYLFSAVLIELDDSEFDGTLSRKAWYSEQLTLESNASESQPISELETSWDLIIDKLLPKLQAALGHPFDTCRDHIARCLFRICYCHRKRTRVVVSRSPNETGSIAEMSRREQDPGFLIVKTFASLQSTEGRSMKDRYNALSTARRFISYCVNFGEAKFEYSDYVIPLLPMAFEALRSSMDDEVDNPDKSSDDVAAKRALEAEVVKVFRYAIAELSVTAVISYGRDEDFDRVLDVVNEVRRHEKWQIRHASANFLRCFQGSHKFLFCERHHVRTMEFVTSLLCDDRREVSSSAMSALTGILAASSEEYVEVLVKKYAAIASKNRIKRLKKGTKTVIELSDERSLEKEAQRARNQQTAVFFLSAAILSQPYYTPRFVPSAIAAISKHSFERSAPLGIRETVKRICAEYKRTHMSDNWELHRKAFTQEQLEALDDVVSSPHYYA